MADPGTQELPFSVTGLQALPYSPRPQKEYVRSTAGREACDDAARITFTDDLAKEAALLLQLLYEVDDAKHLALYSPEGMGMAAERYERFWLPLLATHPNPATIAAPLDVAWAWLMHSLAPSRYAADVQAITGKPAKEMCATSAQNRGPQAVARAQEAWEARFPEEAFDRPGPSGQRQFGEEGTSAFTSRLTYSLVDAAARQQVFLYQVNLPHWEDLSFLRRCVERYKKFLYIRRVQPAAFLVPTFDTDLIWHAHMGCHASYVPDVEKATGRFFDHDDSINDRTSGAKLDVSYRNTYKLWFDTFDEEYVFPGGMYRGKLPGQSLLAAWEELQKSSGDDSAEPITPVPSAEAQADCQNHERTFDVIPIRDDTSQGSISRVFDVVDAAASPKTRYQLVLRSPNVPSAPSASVSVLNSKGQLSAVSRIVGQDQLPFTEEPLRKLSYPMLPSDAQASPAMLIQRCDDSGGSDWGICICEPPHTTACLVDGFLFRLGREFYPRTPESTQGPQYTGKAAFEGGRSRPGRQILRFSSQEPGANSGHEVSWWSCFRGSKGIGEGRKLVAEVRLTDKQQIVVGPGEEAPCALAFGGAICLQAAFLTNRRI